MQERPIRPNSENPITFADVQMGVLATLVKQIQHYTTIYNPEWLIEQGLPQILVKPLNIEHWSSFLSPTSTIFIDGKPVESAMGVYGLQLLEKIGKDLKIDTDTGFMQPHNQSKELIRRILNDLQHAEIGFNLDSIPDTSDL